MEWTDQIIPLGIVNPPRPSTSQGVHEEDQNRSENRIKSRDLIFKKALKSLEPNNVMQMMALCGMDGVGKTTMMEELKKVAKEKKMFDCIVKAAVGQNSNPISIQQTVAEYLGVALTETTKDTRAERLKKTMENISKEGKKKILVILDDVWENVNLEDIGLSSPLPHGFKLLLTSRDENVCNQMGVETSLIFKIVVLQEEEAKTLFWGLVGLGSDTNIPDQDMHHIGEDYYIETEDLLTYGRGLDFFKETHSTIATARDRVHTCVDTLIGLNLLVKSDREECVKMHDLVRDFVLSDFSQVKQASIVSHDKNISEQLRKEVSYERIILKCGDNFELCEDFNQPVIALLTLMEGKLLKFSQDFFTNMEKLGLVAHKPLPQYMNNL